MHIDLDNFPLTDTRQAAMKVNGEKKVKLLRGFTNFLELFYAEVHFQGLQIH